MPGSREATARATTEEDVVLRRGFEAGARQYGALALPYETFARGAREHARRRLEHCGASPERTAEVLGKAHLADLYLATACDLDLPGAWKVLVERVIGSLGVVAGRRGASSAEARDILADLPGELCAPPPSGGARTRIGTYDGSGSLFAWLAVVVSRRVADRVRARLAGPAPHALSIDARPGAIDEADVALARSARPEDRLLEQEAVGDFRRALREAWSRLTDREALVLLWKYRDGMSQRAVARVLDVGEPRVSRLVDAALAKLREGVSRRSSPRSGRGEGAAWALLAETLGSHLASSVPFHDIVGRDLRD